MGVVSLLVVLCIVTAAIAVRSAETILQIGERFSGLTPHERTRFDEGTDDLVVMTAAVAQLISRCQVVAGRFCETTPGALVLEVQALVTDLPSSLSRAEQLVVGEVLDRVLARFVRIAGLDSHAGIAYGFVELANTKSRPEVWRHQWLRITDLCIALLGSHVRPCESYRLDPRVTRMIGFIEERYADTDLSMRSVAEVANVSAWHAARLLKQQTGSGFVAHLHRRRIAVAREMLTFTALSIKEISTAVGYLHPSQFTRHFRAACGMTPLAIRGARLPARHSA